MNDNQNEVVLFSGDNQAVGFSSRLMKSGSLKIGVETRSAWAKANNLKPSSAEARKGYAAHAKEQSARLAAGIAKMVASEGFRPMSVRQSANGRKRFVEYVLPEVAKETVASTRSAKQAALQSENDKLKALLKAAGIDPDELLAGFKAQNEAANVSKVA